MKPDSKIYVAGHNGMVGSAILRNLDKRGYSNIVTRSLGELDLKDQAATRKFFAAEKPEYVFLAAAKVGGIMANDTYRAEFLYDNIMIEANVIDAAYRSGVGKLMFLGSSCVYPRLAPQPIKEESLLTGPLEPTNEPYAVAKIAGIKMCDAYRSQYGADFVSVMPTNLYGPGDNYDPQNSHVLPALIRRFHEAKLSGAPGVTLWGTGTPMREFLHVDDMADATVFCMLEYSEAGPVNIGSQSEISIRSLAEMIRDITGYGGEILWDPSKPDGTPRKLMDSSRLYGMGWRPSIPLEKGIRQVYEEFSANFSAK